MNSRSRSGFLLATFLAWKEARQKERLVKAYENGYRQKPEDASIAEAMAAKTDAFSFQTEMRGKYGVGPQ